MSDATGKAFEAGRSYNPLERAGLSLFDRDKMKLRGDGSATIYMGPKAP